MKVASIDIGTNTTRLAIAETSPFKIIKKYMQITRLGENFDGTLFPEAKKRVIDTLLFYKNIMQQYNISKFRGVATSVTREASDGEEFIDDILKTTGLKIDIIDGKEEAELTLKGVLSVLNQDVNDFLLLDIGGGSNEYTLSKDRYYIDSISLKFGVVFLYEKFIKNDPPLEKELKSMSAEVIENIMRVGNFLKVSLNKLKFVGTAGTITTIAAIHKDLKEYKPEEINNHIIPKKFIYELYEKFSKLTCNERGKKYNIEKGREDVILPGILIILKTMELFNFDNLISIDASLLEGIAYSLL